MNKPKGIWMVGQYFWISNWEDSIMVSHHDQDCLVDEKEALDLAEWIRDANKYMTHTRKMKGKNDKL